MSTQTQFKIAATSTLLFGVWFFILLGNHSIRTLALGWGFTFGVVASLLITLASRYLWLTCVLASALITAQVDAQSLEPEAPAPGYLYTPGFGLEVSMPVYPGQERGGVLIGAVCIGAAVAGLGYIAIKICSAYLKLKEQLVTNNAACGECPQEAPEPASQPVPEITGPPLYTSDCQSCNAAPGGQPLPAEIQHSFDRVTWTPVATGFGEGSEFFLPDTGYWRVVPLPLTVELSGDGVVLHAPPGILEHSDDLREWSLVAVNRQATTLAATPGFYRVRLN